MGGGSLTSLSHSLQGTATVIANPACGRDISAPLIERLLGPITRMQVLWTNGPGHAGELVRQALSAGVRRFVAAGGDGTVNEIAAALLSARSGSPLGILPFGTGNDLARSLGVPLDLERAARLLVDGEERAIDIVRVGAERPGIMVNASVAGLGGDITEGLDRELKRTWGSAVYLRMALDGVASAASFHARIDLDGEGMETQLTNVVVANGKFLGGGIPVAPLARPDDGLLDVIVLPALSTARLFGLVPLYLTGRQHWSRRVTHRRARSVCVEAVSPMPVTIDGEPAGTGRVTYEVVPGAVRVIVPRGGSSGSVRYRLS